MGQRRHLWYSIMVPMSHENDGAVSNRDTNITLWYWPNIGLRYLPDINYMIEMMAHYHNKTLSRYWHEISPRYYMI
jgi:hypothetical protein